MQGLPRERLNELLERGFDLSCTGQFLDRVGDVSQSKPSLLDKMKLQYAENGRRLRDLDSHIHNSSVDWNSFGEYGFEIKGRGRVLHSKLAGRLVTMDKETLGSETGPFRLINNWSTKNAYLKSPREDWSCAHFFPAFARKVKRRVSQERGVTGVPAGGAGVASPAFGASSVGSVAASPIPDRSPQAEGVQLGEQQTAARALLAVAELEEALDESQVS